MFFCVVPVVSLWLDFVFSSRGRRPISQENWPDFAVFLSPAPSALDPQLLTLLSPPRHSPKNVTKLGSALGQNLLATADSMS